MSDNHAAAGAPAHHDNHSSHPDSFYIRIWAILLGLLVLSLIGPEIGGRLNMKALTIVTAFGIAFVKAYMVVKNFMHIGVERKFVPYLLVTMVALMALMVFALAPDVLKHDGHHWENVGAKQSIEKAEKAAAAGGHGEHGEAHEGAHEAPAHEAPAHEAEH